MDIGSATIQLAVSELQIGKRDPRQAGPPEILGRYLLAESGIVLTPYLPDGRIDPMQVELFLRSELAAAHIDVAHIDTGAVICTGEAARRRNAPALTARIAGLSGAFVCAVAGHHTEAVLGAHGSGAVDASRRFREPVVVLDVGGGTAKRSIVSRGRILDTAAINIGTRLLAADPAGTITRCEAASRQIALSAGLDVELGATLSTGDKETLAERMVRSLIQFLGLEPRDALTESLLLTEAPAPLPDGFRLVLSGGLAEYFWGRATADVGDLGPILAERVRAHLSDHLTDDRFLVARGGIRATVLGAGQFSVELSGETVFLDGGLEPPLRNIPVRRVALDWPTTSDEDLERALHRTVRDAQSEGCRVVALAIDSPPAHGYSQARRIADAVAVVLARLAPDCSVVLVLRSDLARTVGAALRDQDPGVPFMCIDELEVDDLDFLDIGRPVRDDSFLPVVVKGLVFDDMEPLDTWTNATGHAPAPA